MASTSVMAGQQEQVPAVPSSHFRTAPRQSYVPSHLRGIEPRGEERSQAPIVASVVAETIPKPVSAKQAPMFQATDEEAWARKMGIIREPALEKQLSSAAPTSTTKPTAQVQSDTVAVTTKPDTQEDAWARKMGILPKAVEQRTSPSKGDTEAEEWARKMGLLGRPAGAKHVTGALQSPATKPQHEFQPPNIANPSTTTQTRASKVGQNDPFNNPQFHLNKNSNEDFAQYIQSSTIANGKKYTFNGLALATQNNVAVSNPTIEHSGGANPNFQQHREIPDQQQGPLNSSGLGQKSVQGMTESRTPLAQNDPNIMFSPNQIAGVAPIENEVAAPGGSIASSNAMKGPWPTLQTADVKSFNQKVAHELNATKQVTGATPLLTQNALAVKTGFTPRAHSHTFEDQISDDGVVELNVKEGIRANQEKNGVDQLADWDKKNWAPAPADWENDRPAFDSSFVPGYIQEEWRPNLPCGPSIQVDTTSQKFKCGKYPINNDVFIDPIEQPESMPGMFTVTIFHRFSPFLYAS